MINFKQKHPKSSLATICLMTALLASVEVSGQLSLKDDTVKIREVIITRKQISSVQPGFKFYKIDSAIINDNSLFSLTEVLKETTPLFLKYYGSGGTATSSFRGTSAGHTQVMWNGININDPMLGQTDFSLIPSGMVENILISFGGASMDLGSGAIGGIINMENEPSWKKETLINLASGAGSLGRYSAMAKVRAGNDFFQTVSKAFVSSAKNNFLWLDTGANPEPVWKKRENNQVLQKGFMQEIYLRKSDDVLSLRLWYQSASRTLPGSTLFGYAGEKQSDESLRNLLTYDIKKGRNEYFINAAWMLTQMNYSSDLYAIDSRNKTNTLVFKSGLSAPIGEYTRLKMIFSNEMNIVTSNNYAEKANRNNAGITISAERKKSTRFGAVLLLREILDDNSLLIPDFSAGLEYRILRGEDHYLKLNLSRNSKIPSLNDMFWNPGGNPDLKNEYAYSFETGYKLHQKIGSSANVTGEINYFNNYIRDMIQWRPESPLLWVSDNIGNVNTSGLEASFAARYKAGNLSLGLNASYSYTRAEEKDSGAGESGNKQLVYIPENQANGSLVISYKSFFANLISNFTGRTYTSTDNKQYLNSYALSNFALGTRLDSKKIIIDLRFRIDNIFNATYQTISYYPQPGRTYFLTLSFHFEK